MNPATNYLINVLGESDEIKRILKDLPVFRNPSEQLIKLIFNYGKVTNLKKGEVLIKEGDFDQWIHILLRGKLSVYIGDQRIDVVNESLVGERCILGETRKATLKAEEDDTSTFAIDMALMDVLENENSEESTENITTLNELVSVIADFVIARLIDLSVKQETSKAKLEKNLKNHFCEKLQHSFSHDSVPKERNMDLAAFKYLREKLPDQMERFWDSENSKPNYRCIYYSLLESNQLHHLIGMIDQMYQKFLAMHPAIQENLDGFLEIHFRKITDKYKEILRESHPEAYPKILENWDDIFCLSKLKLSLCYNLSQFLLNNTDTHPRETVKLIMSFMESSLVFNMTLNKSIHSMNEANALYEIVDRFFYDKRDSQKESKRAQYLSQKLIQPYMDSLSKGVQVKNESKSPAPSPDQEKANPPASSNTATDLSTHPSEKQPNASQSLSNNDLDSLFENAAQESPAENKTLSNDDLDSLFENAAQEAPAENKTLSNNDLDSLFENASQEGQTENKTLSNEDLDSFFK